MRSTLIATTLFAASALASPAYERVQIRQIARRQDQSLDLNSLLGDISTLVPSGCIPPADLYSDVPTPNSEVLSVLATQTDPCETAKVTGSASSAYSSYLSAAESWYNAHSDDVNSFLSAFSTACPVASAAGTYISQIPTYTCGGSGSGPKETGTKAQDSGSNTAANAQNTGASTGAAPQQTAFAKAAGVLMGVVGVVAAL